MAATVNPTQVVIGATHAASDGATEFNVLVGTTSGGPYTVSKATIAISAMTVSGSTYTAPMSALNFSPALVNGTVYFAVAEEANATGAGPNSPEASFQVLPAPANAPESLNFS